MPTEMQSSSVFMGKLNELVAFVRCEIVSGYFEAIEQVTD